MNNFHEKGNEIIQDLLSIAKDKLDWIQIAEKEEVIVYQKYYPSSNISVVKGEGIVNSPLQNIKQLLCNIENNKKWDPLFESGNTIMDLEHEKLSLVSYKTKSKLTVWPREFFVLRSANTFSDGTFVTAGKSIEDYNYFKPDQRCVLGNLIISGFLLTPIDDFTTHVCYILHVDPCGWIPSGIVNDNIKLQPLGIIGIRKELTGKSHS
jgi:hypothetical protein